MAHQAQRSHWVSSIKKYVRFKGTREASWVMCGNCGAWPATHVYDVYLENDEEWVEDIGWCSACALLAEVSGLTEERLL